MIYFIQAGNEGIKIGRTILNVERRIVDMQVGCPIELVLLGTVKGNKEREIELHEKFKKFRLRGEWYSIVIKEEVEVILNTESSPESRGLYALDKAIAKTRAKDIDVIHRLVHKKEKLLESVWSVGGRVV